MPDTIASPWLKVPEAARYGRKSATTIANALRSGELRGSQTVRGGTWLIHRDDLDAYLRGELAPAAPGLRRAK